MKTINIQLLTTICLLLSLISCLDIEDIDDSETLYTLTEGLTTIDCNLEHGLTPHLESEVRFDVLVQDLTGVPIPNVEIIVTFGQFTCNGRSFEVYRNELLTDQNGIVTDFVPFTFEWDNDFGEWNVAISGLGTKIAGYTERFNIDKLSLFHVYSISKLED